MPITCCSQQPPADAHGERLDLEIGEQLLHLTVGALAALAAEGLVELLRTKSWP